MGQRGRGSAARHCARGRLFLGRGRRGLLLAAGRNDVLYAHVSDKVAIVFVVVHQVNDQNIEFEHVELSEFYDRQAPRTVVCATRQAVERVEKHTPWTQENHGTEGMGIENRGADLKGSAPHIRAT